MSKIRVNEIESLDGLNTKTVSSLVDDINVAQTTTSTGEETLVEALERRGPVFDNIQELVSATTLPIGVKVRTLGYFSPGDQGGGDYEIVAEGTGTEDGGSFINLTGSNRQAKRLVTFETISLASFGCISDGLDQTAKIQAALDYAETVNRDVWVGDEYNFTSLTIPTGVRLTGDQGRFNTAMGNSRLISDESTANAITLGDFASIQGVHIRGISSKSSQNGSVVCNGVRLPVGNQQQNLIDAQISNFSGNGLSVGNVGNVVTNKCVFYENFLFGVQYDSGSADHYSHQSVYRDNGAGGCRANAGANSHTYVACRFEWNAGVGYSYLNCNDSQFIGCYFDRNTGNGFENKGAGVRGRVTFSGGIFKRNAVDAGGSNSDWVSHFLIQSVVGHVSFSGTQFLAADSVDGGGGVVVPSFVTRMVNTSDSAAFSGCALKDGYVTNLQTGPGSVVRLIYEGCDDTATIAATQGHLGRDGEWKLRRGAVDRLSFFTNFNTHHGRQQMPNLPTSTVGLSSGELYNDGGTVKLVP